eukprot:TRINITY_DN2_c0_g1_i5.p1 TRINITY_DN2_c0_g1~~TRINITY_DN2_c0_g1_i5.p1  ORF type:complete len:108 (-),score=10.28 TRINITY_DN2_c0_g1_i5:97-420(-)
MLDSIVALAKICIETEVQCIRAPCPPLVSCVDSCANVSCPPGQSCEYNPYNKNKYSCHADCDAGHICPRSTRCVETVVQCVTIPCPPTVSCERRGGTTDHTDSGSNL